MKRALILLLVAFSARGLLAQAAPQAQPANPNETPAPPSAEATAKINEMLEGEEAVLEGLTSSYDPGNRRDPFRSLLAAPPGPALRGPRPEGIAGMLIDEIDLRGIFRTSKGYVAQVAVQNQKKSYLLREGDQLYDGDVLRIDLHSVVFRQIVNDPTVIKPFREVVKKLLP
jgi:hypothetical protein